MPLPNWLKQHDDFEESQPAAATPVPEEVPEAEDQAPEAPEPQDQEPEAPEPQDQAPEDPSAGQQELEDPPMATRAPEAPEPVEQVFDDEAAPSDNDEVLGMLSKIERQLRELGDVQRQHEDQLASLIDRTGPSVSRGAEPAEPEPPEKQPSFVVEMDEGEPGPRGGEDRKGLEDMAAEIETSRDQTDQMRRQLEQAQARINELAEASNDGDDLEETTRQLAAAHEKIEALQSRVIELEAVATVVDADDESDEKDRQIAELTEQVTQLAEALRADEEEQGKPVPAPPPESAGAEMIERQRKQIERLTEQLTALDAAADPEAIDQRDARIAELEEELEEVREGAGAQGVSKLVAGFGGALRQVRAMKGTGDGDEVARLKQHVTELEVECQRLRERAEQAGADGASGDDDEEIAALRARLAELERNPAVAGGELRSKVEAEYRQKWNELKRRQDSLEATEAQMRRKWARPRAVIVFGWLMGLAIVVGVVSWLMAGRIFPPTIAASVNIEAKARTGVPVSDEEKADWQEVHAAMLTDGAFQKTVAKRLADRRYDDYKDPDALAERLREDLTVDSPEPGAITLTLAGTNRHETAAVLDTLATSLATWSSQQAGKRGDGAVAQVRGERREAGQVRFATINETPIRNRRPLGAAIMFGVGFVLSYFLITRIYQGLLRAKSAIDEDEFEVSTGAF